MGIFEKNIAALKKKNEKIAGAVTNIDWNEANQWISVKTASNGSEIVAVCIDNYEWYLNSRLNPEEAADIYWERYPIRLYGTYFVFGFGDGRHVRRLIECCGDTNRIIICVPDLVVFGVVCHYFDIEDLIQNQTLDFYFPEVAEGEVENILSGVIEYTKMKLIDFCILPGYDVRYADGCKKFIDSVIEKIQNEIVNKSTHLGFNRMIPRHVLFHMKKLIGQCNLEQVNQKLEKFELKNIPAIIVSAGPSLDKNVGELKRAQGKSFIIVVDAALRTVLRNGIRPDMVCTIDPESPDRFFENLNLDGLLWSCSRITRPDVIRQFAGKIFYNGYYWGKWNQRMSEELGYMFPILSVGGSVTSEAFQIASYLGFRKIILVGQDMAFTNGISHTEGIEKAFGDNDEYIQSRTLMDVEGIDGKILKTDFQMWCYKRWFEKLFMTNEGKYQIVNATEGGANIVGAQNRTLRETIEEWCKDEIDIYGTIQKIECPFSENQQKKMLLQLKEVKKELEKFEEIIKVVIVKQEDLLEQMQNSTQGKHDEAMQLRELLELNEKLREMPVQELVVLYAQEAEYQMGDEVFQENLEPKDLVQKSTELLRGYQKAIPLLREDIEDYIMKD